MTYPFVELSALMRLVKNGSTFEQNEAGRGYPVSRIETISDGSINPGRTRFVDMTPEEFAKWRLEDGDILFSHINSVEHIGKSAIYRGVPDKLAHGMNLLLLRANETLVLPAYLHAVLQSKKVRETVRARCNRAINQASINQTALGTISMPLPPLEEQQRIVDILDRTASIRKLQRQARETATQVVLALFANMFGDPITNPMGWPRKPLNSVARVTTGNTPPTSSAENYGTDVLLVRPAELGSFLPVQATEKMLSQAGAARARLVRPGAVLVGCIGNIGKVGYSDRTVAINQQINAVEFHHEIEDKFGLALLKACGPKFAEMGAKMVIPILNKGNFQRFEIPCPPINLQRKYAAFVDALFDNSRHQLEAEKLENSVASALSAKLLDPQG